MATSLICLPKDSTLSSASTGILSISRPPENRCNEGIPPIDSLSATFGDGRCQRKRGEERTNKGQRRGKSITIRCVCNVFIRAADEKQTQTRCRQETDTRLRFSSRKALFVIMRSHAHTHTCYPPKNSYYARRRTAMLKA